MVSSGKFSTADVATFLFFYIIFGKYFKIQLMALLVGVTRRRAPNGEIFLFRFFNEL